MKIEETKWGFEVFYGMNCSERVRDLRKLQSCFSRHPKGYEELCRECENLEKKVIRFIEKLDKFEEIDGVWTEEQSDSWSKIYDRMRKVLEKIDNLCIYTYPESCRNENGKLIYSYCV